MSTLTLSNIAVRYSGQPRPAVEGASLSVGQGEFVVLTGRSGCGKSTLLNAAAGLVVPEHGEVSVDGRPIEGPGADRAVVFQSDALFPWFSARDNVAFALRVRGIGERQRHALANELLRRVRLDGLGDKPVWEMSGGMRQRVGLARARRRARLPADGRAARRA